MSEICNNPEHKASVGFQYKETCPMCRLDRLTSELSATQAERNMVATNNFLLKDELLDVNCKNDALVTELAEAKAERDAFRDELFTDHLKETMQKCTEQQIEIFELKKQVKEAKAALAKYEGAVEVVEDVIVQRHMSDGYIECIVPEYLVGQPVTVWVKRRDE